MPLIGNGDWNDGLNRVGVEGKGESVWLAWFLSDVLKSSFSGLKVSPGMLAPANCERSGDCVESRVLV